MNFLTPFSPHFCLQTLQVSVKQKGKLKTRQKHVHKPAAKRREKNQMEQKKNLMKTYHPVIAAVTCR